MWYLGSFCVFVIIAYIFSFHFILSASFWREVNGKWAFNTRLSSFLEGGMWKKAARNSKQASSIRLLFGEGKACIGDKRSQCPPSYWNLSFLLGDKFEVKDRNKRVARAHDGQRLRACSNVFLPCVSGLGRGEANTFSCFSSPTFWRGLLALPSHTKQSCRVHLGMHFFLQAGYCTS